VPQMEAEEEDLSKLVEQLDNDDDINNAKDGEQEENDDEQEEVRSVVCLHYVQCICEEKTEIEEGERWRSYRRRKETCRSSNT
jgi:hypothetical protein